MSVAVRLITGFALGFDLWADKGIYVHLYLGFIEMVFYNEDELED